MLSLCQIFSLQPWITEIISFWFCKYSWMTKPSILKVMRSIGNSFWQLTPIVIPRSPRIRRGGGGHLRWPRWSGAVTTPTRQLNTSQTQILSPQSHKFASFNFPLHRRIAPWGFHFQKSILYSYSSFHQEKINLQTLCHRFSAVTFSMARFHCWSKQLQEGTYRKGFK